MNKIILFTMPNCAPCNVLKQQLETNKQWLTDKNIELTIMNMGSDDETVLNEATKYAVRSAPTAICVKITLQIYDEVVYDTHPCKTFEQIKEFFK